MADRYSINPLALGFDGVAVLYEKARPTYPHAALDWIRAMTGIGEHSQVIDLAAGTGKLTRLLIESGAEIAAVEPLEGMRRLLKDLVPEAEVAEGTAERIPFPDGRFDLVCVAQAFHWFDFAKAIPEIRRVLRKGGHLAVLFNTRDNSVDWVARVSEIIDPIQRSVPAYETGSWRTWLRNSEFFGETGSRVFANEQEVTRELVLERFGSTSYLVALDEAERTAALAQIESLLGSHPDTAAKRTFTLPYVTDVNIFEAI